FVECKLFDAGAVGSHAEALGVAGPGRGALGAEIDPLAVGRVFRAIVGVIDITEPGVGTARGGDGEHVDAAPLWWALYGHAQCFRMRPDGTGIEQLTFDERVNWFPHIAPDGQSIVFISYPAGTTGHPPNKDVILRFMQADGSGQRDIAAFLGGQGTINVNSWAPDSRRFAYVAYPIRDTA
ncbi:MAG: hypothetical protein EOP21_15450, partial [Hyphomicrobiales bacterium]